VTFLWNLTGPRLVHELDSRSGGLRSVHVSPDGRRLATGGSRGTAYVWDVASGRLRHSLEGHTNDVSWVRFSPDGRSIATAGWEGPARLWDAQSGHALAELRGDLRGLSSVRFDARGTLLVTASNDGSSPGVGSGHRPQHRRAARAARRWRTPRSAPTAGPSSRWPRTS
jgi:WD40 repeat protein